MFTQFDRHPFLVFNTEGGDGGGGGEATQQGGQDGVEPPAYTPPATQEEFNRVIESRLARERQKYADYEDLKKKAAEHDQYLESQKTEHEKALEAARAEAAGETRTKFLGRIVSSEVKLAATAAGFTDPGDVLAFLDSEELVKDDEPDVDAIKKAIDKLATDKPYLLKAGKPTPRTRPKPGTGEQTDTATEAGKGKAAAALRALGASRKTA
ncbi:phage scaffolding protein [Microbacterium resistens]|uniref:Phage scaffolding protein n=1 Tax=Microbacterium resistens TaxID=156977 RepID=A0ABY3RU35_9MICO|nr:phage scaffolding protein [Microbacterium resistens]UGS27587.1 phage scaffolding protein [Microbacterium resistens]